MNLRRKSLAQKYYDAKVKLNQAQKEEKALRQELLELHLSDLLEGTRVVEEDGFRITCTAKLIYSLDAELLSEAELSAEEQEAVVWKPSLKLSEYRKLDDASGLETALTTKPGLGSIKIEES